MALLRRDDRIERILTVFREENRAWYEAMREDDRQFMREMLLRSEKLQRDTTAALRDISRRTDEVIAEQRAQRGALLAILDRLGGGPAPPLTDF